MKKQPKAVYIIENGGYTELTYEEFRRREQICPLYADKLFLPLYGRLMEVSKEDYAEFYRAKRRQKYLDERSANNGDFSYDMLTTDEFSGEDILIAEQPDVCDTVVESIMTDKLRKAKNYPLTRTLLCPDCGRTFRRQVVNGTAYWLCAAKATNKTDCAWRRVKEDEVYAAFNLMIRKVQANREYLLGTLIRQLEELQYRTTGSQQRIKEIDREIADLTAQNLVLSRLHGKGVLNAADYTAQSDVLENKITELRIERRTKITDSDENEMLDELKMLNDILKEVEIGIDFDAELFEQTVDNITVESNELLTFHLAGGISLPEKIREKGRCYKR